MQPADQPAGLMVVAGAELARYGFGDGHPFGTDRHDVFMAEFNARGHARRSMLEPPRMASDEELASFHDSAYLQRVREQSRSGSGYLDGGDTPAIRGIYEIAATAVGATLTALEGLMSGKCRRAFVPIAGLHHAARGHASGFCVFNDCGVAIEQLRRRYGVRRVAYVDIDAHHGDGVYYAFENDPELIFADLHEDGRYLFPGTGHAEECGQGAAAGTKLNLPLPPGADDAQFALLWPRVLDHLRKFSPEFIILQCGADSLSGDPITHLALSAASHARAARDLAVLADEFARGRLLATGGGGYSRRNIAVAWNEVVGALLDS
ncbi:MAG: acetoin utilization protein AcuC [Steroidobacteraceae bacterium]